MTPDRRIGQNIVVPPADAEAAPVTPPIHPATPALGGLAGRIQARHDRRDAEHADDAAFFTRIGNINLDPIENPTTVDRPYDPTMGSVKAHGGAGAAKAIGDFRASHQAFETFKTENPGLEGGALMVAFRASQAEASTKAPEPTIAIVDTPRTFIQEQAAIQANRTRDRVKEHRQRQTKYAELHEDTGGPELLRDKRAIETYTEEERMMPGAKKAIKRAGRYTRLLDRFSDARMAGLRSREQEQSMAHELIKAKRGRKEAKKDIKVDLTRLLPKRIRNREPGTRLPRR